MKIPKIITRKTKYKTGEIREHTYKFVKQCNDDLFLYEEVNQHYKECFSKYDLGIKTRQMKITHVNPEKVKIRKKEDADDNRERRTIQKNTRRIR